MNPNIPDSDSATSHPTQPPDNPPSLGKKETPPDFSVLNDDSLRVLFFTDATDAANYLKHESITLTERAFLLIQRIQDLLKNLIAKQNDENKRQYAETRKITGEQFLNKFEKLKNAGIFFARHLKTLQPAVDTLQKICAETTHNQKNPATPLIQLNQQIDLARITGKAAATILKKISEIETALLKNKILPHAPDQEDAKNLTGLQNNITAFSHHATHCLDSVQFAYKFQKDLEKEETGDNAIDSLKLPRFIPSARTQEPEPAHGIPHKPQETATYQSAPVMDINFNNY
ncbi:hypothetical protein OH491_24265 [Termitidicoccus mucosus]|uniref:Uncharacterized protein n=1 Tax=Termitidicoccus mucosus TaxID=1184151 RepID=A0A178IQI1_9BACT|nr:hypothetical protein AW736_02185 [Opitutaceae bacterium TSB47]